MVMTEVIYLQQCISFGDKPLTECDLLTNGYLLTVSFCPFFYRSLTIE